MNIRILKAAGAVLVFTGTVTTAQAQLSVQAAESARDKLEAEYKQKIAAAEAEVTRAKALAAAQEKLARAEADRTAAQAEIAKLAPAGAAADGVAANSAAADGAAPSQALLNKVATAIEDKKTADAIAKADRDFGGIKLGAGLSLTLDIGDNDRITEAAIVNGVVRVRNADNTPARLLFESHYLFKPKGSLFGVPHKMWGVGPFVAIHPGEDEIINAIGMGVMIAFRREETKSDSFNFGLGVIIDPNVQLLGEGIVANMPLPPGETVIRYRESSQVGIMAMTSFSF